MKKELHNSTRRSISSRQSNSSERPRTEVSAGGLVFKRTRRGIYFAMLKDSFGKWTFPKGHVRRGEAYDKAAEREIFEETGLVNVRKVQRLGTIDIWFRDRFVYKGRLIHKYIHYFLFEVPADSKLKKPKSQDHGEKIQAVSWVPVYAIQKRSTYKDMKKVIDLALKNFKNTETRTRQTSGSPPQKSVKPQVDQKGEIT
ncbi:hypothetical protein CO173_04835 [Candidatus Uhrbacteria bacterium CG_4_9_14_3_um_filter_41_35]|uniref:Nudix hydrolase domain-containing protein n=1 Tax=Candidatus Uhrbacteria bacterium CG_4_9_14_3_um_filter_41_35 TaxID=1975034 RepID=A0A2M7XCZ2_9BACT|nr:MAG: hypothetical protein COV92_01925 [Candidatus Uhrbacteria bacterium CG11_big_fil_rev_8_21_14_0_20_41_9]PJA45748.1 MAG: hypothetical protein CO173_04835 [Candidatus Uhrbacteria bacterium CG_4_9_14_3_um_filter_41_35]